MCGKQRTSGTFMSVVGQGPSIEIGKFENQKSLFSETMQLSAILTPFLHSFVVLRHIPVLNRHLHNSIFSCIMHQAGFQFRKSLDLRQDMTTISHFDSTSKLTQFSIRSASSVTAILKSLLFYFVFQHWACSIPLTRGVTQRLASRPTCPCTALGVYVVFDQRTSAVHNR